MTGARYGKQDKLKSRKAIEALFAGKQRVSMYPLLAWYGVHADAPAGLQAGVACSKRYFKKAVDRNRVKRLMREAYRLQKAHLAELVSEKNVNVAVLFVFTGAELPVYTELYATMERCLGALAKKIKNAEPA